ncbi:MAG: trypsin-like serine protease [Myxococcaceae bacterium]
MISKPLVAALACLFLLACGPAVFEVTVDPGEQVERADQSIKGGVLAKEYPEGVLVDWMGTDQKPHVCSGVVIAPKVVLTAGHCVVNVSGWRVRAPYAGNQEIATVAGYVTDKTDGSPNYNQHDLGILILASPIELAQYPTIRQTPVPVGADVSVVGRVKGSEISRTDLFMAPVIIEQPSSKAPFHYVTGSVIRGGDSGGPVFLGGTHTVVAVNSIFNSALLPILSTTQWLARVDLEREWVAKFIANPNANSCYVKGAILDRYRALGALASPLGDCVTNELAVADGVGRVSHFQDGSIYWTPATGAHEVLGANKAQRQSLGWETSKRGYPISGEEEVPGGRRSRFQGGSISWTAATGALTVQLNP